MLVIFKGQRPAAEPGRWFARGNVMPSSHRALVIAVLLLAPCSVLAQERTVLRLICEYSQAVDAEGKVSASSGEKLFTISFGKTGMAEIKKEGLGAPFQGKVSDDEIVGDVTYTLGDVTITETVTINRFTGSFTATYGSPGRGGLIHYGKCKNARERLF